MNKKSLGYLIKHYRELKGLSMSEFARQMGVSFQTIYNWETNRKVPSLDKYKGISKILGVEVAEFSKYFK